jgi:hypothetical protein
MTESEWVEFAYKGFPHVASVGRLDAALCAELSASTNLVRIRHDYVCKLMHKHKWEPHRLAMMEICMAFGRVIRDRPWHLTFFHFDEIVYGGWHHLTIKSADHGHELWVATFHPQSPSEVKRLTARGTLIRSETA